MTRWLLLNYQQNKISENRTSQKSGLENCYMNSYQNYNYKSDQTKRFLDKLLILIQLKGHLHQYFDQIHNVSSLLYHL